MLCIINQSICKARALRIISMEKAISKHWLELWCISLFATKTSYRNTQQANNTTDRKEGPRFCLFDGMGWLIKCQACNSEHMYLT